MYTLIAAERAPEWGKACNATTSTLERIVFLYSCEIASMRIRNNATLLNKEVVFASGLPSHTI